MSKKRRAVQQPPVHAPAARSQPAPGAALFQQALIAHQAGRLDEAEALYRRTLAQAPRNFDAVNNLAVVLKAKGRIDEAIACYRTILSHKPQSPHVYNNMSCAYAERDQLAEALEAAQIAVRQKPDYAEGYFNLGNILRRLNRLDEAIAAYRQALVHKADFAAPWSNLGEIFKTRNQLAEAIQCYANAIRLGPGLVEAYNNLGEVFKEQGKHREAREIFARALGMAKRHPVLHSNLVFLLNYDPDIDPATVFKAHREWATVNAAPVSPAAPVHANPRDPSRRLKIGYVSPDLCGHSVSYFLEPVLEHHDRSRFAIHAYSVGKIVDQATERMRGQVDVWREASLLSDEALAAQIRADGIDILVDLAGHTANGRLTTFARRPAPVQVTWIGYPNTTGMTEIDYRFVDAVTDPPGLADQLHSEKLWRLPDGFLCYRPPGDSPEVAPLPALRNGHVTFGSFNNLAKLKEPVVRTWAEILDRVPGSRLLLKSKQLADGETRQRIQAAFAAAGIAADRLDLRAALASTRNHLDLYGEVDLGLDPFPYNGTTTTCESLWMGVPVVTLLGTTHVGRVGASLALRTGLGHLVAPDLAAYRDTAVTLARDLAGLAELRAGLRERVRTSPLCDAGRFTGHVEAAYREMWRQWCEGTAATTVLDRMTVPA